jgi:hypothetical protein
MRMSFMPDMAWFEKYKRWIVIGLIALCTFLLVKSCGIDQRWEEEIQLQSGDVIVIKRTAKGKRMGGFGDAPWWEPTEMTLAIGDSEVAEKPPKWRFPYVPILFDYDAEKREWFVVATFVTCKAWYEIGRPKLPYIEYRARGDQWEVTPLSPELIGRDRNLFVGISPKQGSSLLALDDKKVIRNKNSVEGEKYRRIVSVWRTTC